MYALQKLMQVIATAWWQVQAGCHVDASAHAETPEDFSKPRLFVLCNVHRRQFFNPLGFKRLLYLWRHPSWPRPTLPLRHKSQHLYLLGDKHKARNVTFNFGVQVSTRCDRSNPKGLATGGGIELAMSGHVTSHREQQLRNIHITQPGTRAECLRPLVYGR